MNDFTLTAYMSLLSTLQGQGYAFQTLVEFINNPLDRAVILRHDVDKKPSHAFKMARIETEAGISASYYFRTVKHVLNSEYIRHISRLGHEVGYHYENLSAVSKREDFRKFETRNPKFEKNTEDKPEIPNLKSETKSNDQKSNDRNKELLYELAIEDFKRNLGRFREIVQVKTICMHGSPLSRHDNRELWKVYNYRDFGIICEPYFDLDFSQVFYLTDTGRRWDGESVNLRDKVDSKSEIRNSKLEINTNVQNSNDGMACSGLADDSERSGKSDPIIADSFPNDKDKNDAMTSSGVPNDTECNEPMTFPNLLRLHSTFDIIDALEKGLLPNRIMINTHPQRWTNNPFLWGKELVWQNFKNLIKKYYLK